MDSLSSPTRLLSPELDQNSALKQEFVSVAVDFIPCASPEAAQTLYREDEAAYRAACGRNHVLRLGRRKRPRTPSMRDECLRMIRRAQGMKSQRANVLSRLQEAQGKRAYVEWELTIATEKMESRAARVDAAGAALEEWISSKGLDSSTSRLKAVLTTASGRRAWISHMEEVVAKSKTKPLRSPYSPLQNRGAGSSGKNGSSTSMWRAVDSTSSNERAHKIPPTDQPSLACGTNVKTDEQPEELAPVRGQSETEFNGGAFQEEMLSSPTEVGRETEFKTQRAVNDDPAVINVAKLYLALDALGGGGKDARGGEGVLDPRMCAELQAQWPVGKVPANFDPALLGPTRSDAKQTASSDAKWSVEDLEPAREVVRLEAQRLFFDGFLESCGGQTFVLNTIADGTLAARKAESYTTRLSQGAELDEDVQGYRRFLVHADEWMHSRLVHEGVEQRVRVEAAEPVLRTLLDSVDRFISDSRGELAVIVQSVYSLAAPQAQRAIRGALERNRLPARRREVLNYASLCAAVEVQRTFRGAVIRWRARQALVARAAVGLAPLQACIRGFLVRQRIIGKWKKIFDEQAVVIQRVFRGSRCRGRLQAALKANKRTLNGDLREWAAVEIQRYARAWLGKSAVRAKRVDVSLSFRASKLADRLVTTAGAAGSKGVSELLRQVDTDYRRYERTIREMKEREHKMATTFINKVLERRDADIAYAWNSFVSAAVRHVSASQERRNARRLHPTARASRSAARNKETQRTKVWTLLNRYLDPAQLRTLPSPFLRSALPAHLCLRKQWAPSADMVTEARTAKRRRVGSPIASLFHQDNGLAFSNENSSINIAETVDEKSSTTPRTVMTAAGPVSRSDSRSFLTSSQICHQASVGSCAEGGSGGIGASTSAASTSHKSRKGQSASFDMSVVKNDKRTSYHPCSTANSILHHRSSSSENNITVNSLFSSERTPSRGYTQGGTSGPGAAADSGKVVQNMEEDGTDRDGLVGWEAVWDTTRADRGLIGTASSRFPGSSVRQDMPLGLEETVERFCAAAFLRGYVPHGLMPTGTTPEEAFERYLKLPPSLAKIRQEQLGREASKRTATALRSRGFLHVHSLLPPSKLKHLFRAAGADEGVTLAASALAQEIKTASSSSADNDRCSTSCSFSCRAHRQLPEKRPKGKAFPEADKFSRDALSSGEGWPSGGRLARSSGARKKKGPTRISLGGLALEGESQEGHGEGSGRWDPRRYASRPEEWFKPPASVVKRRWDAEAKTFVAVNNYSFDQLYRKHNPRDCHADNKGEHSENNVDDKLGASRSGTSTDPGNSSCKPKGGVPCTEEAMECPSRPSKPDVFGRKLNEIMREEYGTFFHGMTPTAVELYKYMIDDASSWGHVEDPVSTLMCRAAFYIVGHPSPPTKAELDVAKEMDHQTKRLRGGTNRLARPITLAGKFLPGEEEQELIDAALMGEQVSIGLEAFRAFVKELDATPSPSPESAWTGNMANTTLRERTHNFKTDRVSDVDGRYGCVPPDRRRILLKRRLEAAEMLAKPFALRLEADGVSSVKIFARTPVRTWGLPDSFVEQAERILGLLTAKFCATEYYTDKRIRNKPFERGGDRKRGRSLRRRRRRRAFFDPRFQRSPLDPFGRPPRLERIQPCPKDHCYRGPESHKNHDMNLSTTSSSDTDNDDILPSGFRGSRAQNGMEKGEREVDRCSRETKDSVSPVIEGVMPPSVIQMARSTPSNPCGRSDSLNERVERYESPAFLVRQQKGGWLEGQDWYTPPRPVPGFRCERKRRPPNRRGRLPATKKAGSNGVIAGCQRLNAGDHRQNPDIFVCRKPSCGAAFMNLSTWRKHEQSHKIAPEYHRLKRAPQLFRDAPTAPWEGAGAPQARYRLRTNLPDSVQRDLDELERESAARQRDGLMALPGLAGVATRLAGEASPETIVTANG